MTDHPKPGSTFYVHALCIKKLSLLAVPIATPEAVLSLVQMIYCTDRIKDIKNNLVHYAYSESQLINEAISYFFELTDSCKYESISYLLYTRKPNMDEYTC